MGTHLWYAECDDFPKRFKKKNTLPNPVNYPFGQKVLTQDSNRSEDDNFGDNSNRMWRRTELQKEIDIPIIVLLIIYKIKASCSLSNCTKATKFRHYNIEWKHGIS